MTTTGESRVTAWHCQLTWCYCTFLHDVFIALFENNRMKKININKDNMTFKRKKVKKSMKLLDAHTFKFQTS